MAKEKKRKKLIIIENKKKSDFWLGFTIFMLMGVFMATGLSVAIESSIANLYPYLDFDYVVFYKYFWVMWIIFSIVMSYITKETKIVEVKKELIIEG